jgi:hypothetical protein
VGIIVVERPATDAAFFNHETAESQSVALEHPNVEWSRDWERLSV